MKKTTPTLKLNQILILSKLIDGPMRYNQLWEAVKFQTKSKHTFGKSLDSLIKEGNIERIEIHSNQVIYRISQRIFSSEDLSIARRTTPWGSIELITDCMEFLIKSPVFSNKEEAMQAAIGFWVERYRNLCVLDALFSLIDKENNDEDFASELRSIYQVTENKFFDVALRFKKKHPHLFRTVLEKKLFFKGIDLGPSWIHIRLDKFLKTYFPKAYEKLSKRDKERNYFQLLRNEREREYIHCRKRKREFPRWVCRFCKFYTASAYTRKFGRLVCKYRKVPTTQEKILSKRKHWPKQHI